MKIPRHLLPVLVPALALTFTLLVHGSAPPPSGGTGARASIGVPPAGPGAEPAVLEVSVGPGTEHAPTPGRVAAADDATTIHGSIQLSNRTGDLTEVTVVAVPRTGPLQLRRNAYAVRLEDPGKHGWFVTQPDANGQFELGPGLDPALTYTVVAAGAGETAASPFGATWRIGDEVRLELLPVVGAEAILEDARDRPFDWRRANQLFGSSRIGWGELRSGVRGQDTRPVTQAASLRHLQNLELALLSLPSFADGERATIFVVDDSRGEATWSAQMHMSPPNGPRPQSTWLELGPIATGVQKTTVTLEEARPRDDAAELVVHFPEALVELLLDGKDTTNTCLNLEVQGSAEGGAFYGDAFALQLSRGQTTWRTRDVPPGRHRLTLFSAANHWLNLTDDPGGQPTSKDRQVEVATDGPTHVHLPEHQCALVRIGDLTSGPLEGSAFSRLRIEGPDGPGYSGVCDSTETLPLFFKPGQGHEVRWSITTYLHGGTYALVDAAGRQSFGLASYKICDLRLGARVGPLPGPTNAR